MGVAPEAFPEIRAQRTVDQTASQDRFFGGAAFTTEEGSWDPTSGIHALFDIYRQRKEIGSFTHLLGSRSRDEDFDAPEGHFDSSVGQQGQLSCAHGDLFATNYATYLFFGHGFSFV